MNAKFRRLLLPFAICLLTLRAGAENPATPSTPINRVRASNGLGVVEFDCGLSFKNNSDRVALATELGIAGGVTGVYSVNGLTGTVTITAGGLGLGSTNSPSFANLTLTGGTLYGGGAGTELTLSNFNAGAGGSVAASPNYGVSIISTGGTCNIALTSASSIGIQSVSGTQVQGPFIAFDGINVGGGASASETRFLEPSGTGANYTGFKAPALAADVMYTMPNADGSAGQTLKTDGSKALGWQNAVTGITGTANQVIASGSTGAITLSLPQSIGTGSSPSFAGITLTAPLTVGNGGLGIASGTSGGIPYFSSTSAIASTAALTANRIVLGGGAGVAPTILGSLGTTTTVLHGNAAGAPSFAAVSLTADVTGTLGVASGGTNASTFTAGSIVFAGTSGTYTQSNASFFWDNTNKRLGLATTTPQYPIHSIINGNSYLLVQNTSSYYGGATPYAGILLGEAPSNGGSYMKGGIFFKNIDASSGYGRGQILLALEPTANSSNVDSNIAASTVFGADFGGYTFTNGQIITNTPTANAIVIRGTFDATSRGTNAIDIQSENSLTYASGVNSLTVGNRNNSTQTRSNAVGYSNTASAVDTTSVGNYNVSNVANGTAVGYQNTAGGNSIAAGYINTAIYSGAAFGYSNSVGGSGSADGTGAVFGYGNNGSTYDYIYLFGKSNVAGASHVSVIGEGITNATASSVELGPSDTAKARITSTGVLKVRRGAAATFANVGGSIFDYYTDIGNVGTGEDDLISSTLDASLLSVNGDKATAKYQGTFTGAATSTQDLRAYFGGTKIYDSGALNIGVASYSWTMTVTCIRVSSSVVRCGVSVATDFATVFPYSKYTEVTGLTLTNTQIMKLTGEAVGAGAANNQILSKLGTVSYMPSAN